MSLKVNIKKRLGNFNLDVAFETERGVFAILGASGCGKSMTLKCIAGIETPDEGRIELNGRVLYDSAKKINLTPQKRRVGYMFQDYALFPNMTVEQNIKAGMGKHPEEEKVRSYINRFRLEGMEKHYPAQLSGGQKQRIAIARAILKNAPILILDEATSASDPENQMEIDKAIQNLCKGKTVIVVAHRLSALKMCERVAVVENHTITCVGTHEEVRKNNAYYRKAWEDYETARNITYQLEGGEQHE